jgi:hypothetical protein
MDNHIEANMKKYGVKWLWESKEIRDRVIKTNIERYGTDNPGSFGGEIFKNSIINKYGVDNVQKDPVIKRKFEKTMIKRYGGKCTARSKELNIRVQKTIENKYKDGKAVSKAESYLSDLIKNEGYTVINNSRDILDYGLEIDIFIPELNLAIEYNGIY